MEVKHTLTLTEKSKILITIAAIAAVLVVAVPYAAFALPAANNDPVQGTRDLLAKGVARQTINGENVTVPANFTLTLEKTGDNATIPKFNVISGTIDVNGTIYTITSGNGGVIRSRHLILLQAQGTQLDGQTVTLKLAGRYFWMGGHLYVIRMIGSLQTESGKEVLLMRGAIRV